MEPTGPVASRARRSAPADLFRSGSRLRRSPTTDPADPERERRSPEHVGRALPMPPDQRRAAILEAAAPLLRRLGHDVTTRQIAEAAGIAEGTVFRAFPTKQAIVDAVVEQAFDVSGTVARIRTIDTAGPLQDRVRACATILADRLAMVMELMIALRMHRPPQPPADHPADPGERHRQHREGQGETLVAIAELLAPDADRLSCPPERAAHLLRLLAFAGTHRLINDDNPLTPDEITEVLLHGILRPAAEDPDSLVHGILGPAPDEDGLPPPAAAG